MLQARSHTALEPKRDISENLSYMIPPEGTAKAVMPDQDPTFGLGFIQGVVGAHPELACFTSDGFALVQSREAKDKDLPTNDAASSLLHESTGSTERVYGTALLIHPNHLDRRLFSSSQ